MFFKEKAENLEFYYNKKEYTNKSKPKFKFRKYFKNKSFKKI